MFIPSLMTVVIVGKSSKLNTISCDSPSQYTRWNWGYDLGMLNLRIKSRLAWEPCDYLTFLSANLNRHVKAVHLGIKAYSCHLCDHKASASHLRC